MILQIIQREFVEILGPMAHVIWAEQVAKGDLPSDSLIENLARELHDERQAREFRAHVRRSLAAVRSRSENG